MVGGRDSRRLDVAAQAELRRVAVGMVEAGETRIEAAAAVGANRRFVGAWVAAVERSGEAALAGGQRGRRPDERKAVSPRQEIGIERRIADRCPDRLDLPFALWTREAVGVLVECQTGMRLSKSTIGSYPRDWRFTARRPQKRATERREPEVEAWLGRDYPPVERAKAEAAEIHWGDETGATRQAFPTRPATDAVSPPRARRQSSRGPRHAFPGRCSQP